MGNNFAKFQAMENAWEKKLRPSVIRKSYGKIIPIAFPHTWYVDNKISPMGLIWSINM